MGAPTKASRRPFKSHISAGREGGWSVQGRLGRDWFPTIRAMQEFIKLADKAGYPHGL
jgi:hypothetical protein